MKTIEERAKEYAPDPRDPDYILYSEAGYVVNRYRDAYIAGATEQKAIDIDKACEWLESHFRDIENPDFYSKRNHPTDLESMYHWSVKELVDDFRKAMEERYGQD